MTETQIATVEVPFEALVKELGAKRAIKFLSEIRKNTAIPLWSLEKLQKNLQ